MSSSKIIKSERLQQVKVASVSYGGLSGSDPGVTSDAAGTFMPLLFESAAAQGAASGAATIQQPTPEPEPAGLRIAEEELQQRLDAAYNKGVDEGRQQAERGLANVFRSLREGVDALARLRDKVLHDSEEDLLKLVIMVSRKIIQQEISHDPQILAKIIAETISCCSDFEKVTIRLNPDDCSRVEANRSSYLTGIGSDTQISIIPDETILPGGCMVDTVTGTIDARIDVQLDEIYRKFVETRGVPDEDASAMAMDGAQ